MKQGVDCAWCGSFMHGDPASVVRSHGICGRCLASTGMVEVEQLHELGEQEANDLPFGLMHLDHQGHVLKYNYPEASLSGLDPAEVIGRDFFNEIAPCTRVQEFQGRFEELQASGQPGRVDFRFVFQFQDGARLVHIVMSHLPGSGTVILVEDQG